MIRSNQNGPTCTRCRNHNEPFVRLKGHRKYCPWKNCECEMCILITQRGGLNREKAKLMEAAITGSKRQSRPAKIHRAKQKKSLNDDKRDQDFHPETTGLKTKYKRKSKPQKLVSISPPNCSYATTAHQESAGSPLQGTMFGNTTLQFKPTYQDTNFNRSQHNILYKDPPGSFYCPAAVRSDVGLMGLPVTPPGNVHLQVNKGYLTPYGSFSMPFNEESQSSPHYSPKPKPCELESRQLQELQVCPAIYDNTRNANSNTDGRFKLSMSCMQLNHNQGFLKNDKGGTQAVHWISTSTSNPD